MLVLTRKLNEQIYIGHNIRVMIVSVDRSSGKVRLGIDAPTEIPVHRHEVYEAIQREQHNGRLLPAVVEGVPKAVNHELQAIKEANCGDYQI